MELSCNEAVSCGEQHTSSLSTFLPVSDYRCLPEGRKSRLGVSCRKNPTVGVVFSSLDLLEERQQGFQNMRHGMSNLPFVSVSHSIALQLLDREPAQFAMRIRFKLVEDQEEMRRERRTADALEGSPERPSQRHAWTETANPPHSFILLQSACSTHLRSSSSAEAKAEWCTHARMGC